MSVSGWGMIKDGEGTCRSNSVRVKGAVRRLRPNAIVAAILSMQAGAAWANQECGSVGPGLEPEVTCESDAAQYAGGIRYLMADIPNGLRLVVKPDVIVNRASGLNFHGIDVATDGSNGIAVYLADGAKISVSGQDSIGLKLKGDRDIFVDTGANIDAQDSSGAANNLLVAAIYAETLSAASTGTLQIRQREGSKLTGGGVEATGIFARHRGSGVLSVWSAGEIDVQGENAGGIIVQGEGGG